MCSSRIAFVLTLSVCLFGVALADDVEHVNIFTKLKDAMTSALIGLVLLIVVPIAIFWNEVRIASASVPHNTRTRSHTPTPTPARAAAAVRDDMSVS
jgi:hypothetical protein